MEQSVQSKTKLIRVPVWITKQWDEMRGDRSYAEFLADCTLPVGYEGRKKRFADWRLIDLEVGESQEFRLDDHDDIARLITHIKYIHRTQDVRLKLDTRLMDGDFWSTVTRFE